MEIKENFLVTSAPYLKELYKCMTDSFNDLNGISSEETIGYEIRTKSDIVRDNYLRHVKNNLPNIEIREIDKNCKVIVLKCNVDSNNIYFLKVKKMTKEFYAEGNKTNSVKKFCTQQLSIEGNGFIKPIGIYIGYIPDPYFKSFNLYFVQPKNLFSYSWKENFNDLIAGNVNTEQTELFSDRKSIIKPKFLPLKQNINLKNVNQKD